MAKSWDGRLGLTRALCNFVFFEMGPLVAKSKTLGVVTGEVVRVRSCSMPYTVGTQPSSVSILYRQSSVRA